MPGPGARAGRRAASARPGRGRLSRSADFERVFRHGRSHAGRELVLYVFPREGGASRRLGLSVSRKVGGAVERNRVKRALREAFAVDADRLPEGTDAVIVARHEARGLVEREGLAGVRSALQDLIARAFPGTPAPKPEARPGIVGQVEDEREPGHPPAEVQAE